MAQGSHMQLQIQNSRKGLAFCGLLYLVLVLLLLQAQFAPALQMPVQALLAWCTWSAYRSTGGLGRGPVTLAREGGDWYLTGGGRPPQRIRQIRAGLVRPWLLSAQLQGEHGKVSLLVFDDATDVATHWALRSLALGGIPPKDGDDGMSAKG